jgi:hypothetical protein
LQIGGWCGKLAATQTAGLSETRSMNYWLDCFTGTTWREFQEAGARVTGFNERFSKQAGKIAKGDVFLCYLIGVQRWVGALEVAGQSQNQTRIWQDNEYPVRFDVRPLLVLEAEHGVPMEELAGKVDFFATPADKGGYKGFVRLSPNRFKKADDGRLILALLQGARDNPVSRPVDPKKLAQKPYFKAERQKGKTREPTLVSVPEPEPRTDQAADPSAGDAAATTRHTEIQYALLNIGREMGLDVWVARNDRRRTWNASVLGDMPGMIAELPTQFNEATNRTIELIDVLWLKGNAIVAAFEVECTTSVYSGLLRMSDLLALQPNLDIDLYLVAPDERRSKVEQEIQRPTFKLREKPLPSVCGFLSFSNLMEKVLGIQRLGLAKSLKPDFLKATAEYFDAEASEEQ